MPTAVKWSALGSAVTVTITLNSVANAANAISTTIDNDTARDQFALVELVVTYGTAPAVNGYIGLYLIDTLDATNFEDGTASVDPAVPPDAVFPLRAVTTAQRIIRHVMLPPNDFQFLVANEAGQAISASGNTLKYRPYNSEAQ